MTPPGAVAESDDLKSSGSDGVKGGCRLDNWNADGVITFDLDGKASGKNGDITVKGHLDVVCRKGL